MVGLVFEVLENFFYGKMKSPGKHFRRDTISPKIVTTDSKNFPPHRFQLFQKRIKQFQLFNDKHNNNGVVRTKQSKTNPQRPKI